MEWFSQFWDQGVDIVTLVIAFLGMLGTLGFLRKEKITRGEKYTLELERNDLRKRLAKAEVRLNHVDPKKFLDQVSELESNGEFAHAAEKAEQFGRLQSEAFGRAAILSAEDAIIQADGTRLDLLEDAVRFVSIGLASDPENKRLMSLSEETRTRLEEARAGGDFETLHLDGMTDVDLNKMANKLIKEGKFALAEIAARRSLPLARERTGPVSQNYAAALGTYGRTLDTLGQYTAAEKILRQTLEIAEKTIGTAHPLYANCLNNLSEVVREQGRFEEAETLYREALAIDEKTIGTAHPSYATHLNNLAMVVEAQERFEEAEPLYREAIKIALDRLGAEHPQTRTLQANLDDLLAKQP